MELISKKKLGGKKIYIYVCVYIYIYIYVYIYIYTHTQTQNKIVERNVMMVGKGDVKKLMGNKMKWSI